MFEQAIEVLNLIESELSKGVAFETIVKRITMQTPVHVTPPATRKFKVTDTKAIARFAYKMNLANPPRPIMQIYPGDSSVSSDRVRFNEGDIVDVSMTITKADGGGLYYRILQPVQDGNGKVVSVPLYLSLSDGVIT